MKPVEFWFSISSTYSYLTVSRVAQVAQAKGVAFDCRPFDVHRWRKRGLVAG